MRWMKHMTAAHQDIALSAILEEFGAEGYGIYWLILEHFSQVLEKDMIAVPPLAHSVVSWSKICHCSARTFRKFAQTAADLKLISCTSLADLKQFASRTQADRLQIEVPKLLKYRDEWSKRSGVAPEQSSIDTYTDKEKRQNGAPAPPGMTPPAALKVLAPPPRWKTDPQFRDFTEKASAAWGDLIDADFEDAYHCWRVMDFEHRLACLKAIDTRVEMKTDFHFVARPAKFLKTREYYRPVSQLKTKDDEAIEQARKILKRKMK